MFINLWLLYRIMKTIEQIKEMKGKEKIVMLTAYDYCFAKIMDNLVDIILVGDSLGNVVLGYKTTRAVKMQDMLRAVSAVARGSRHTMIVADMPYGADKNALKNAQRLLKAGADAVKIEGKVDIVAKLVKASIPVMAHIGFLPQTEKRFRVVGKGKEAKRLIKDAIKFEDVGAFAIVLECIPVKVAKVITSKLKIPTIGIGAGPYCDGQVLVSYDLVGLFTDFKPRFVKRYTNLSEIIKKAIIKFRADVKAGKFPKKEHSFEK